MDCLRMAEEVERTRTLESKAFQEKEQLRSKLEEVYEEKERIFQVHLCVGSFVMYIGHVWDWVSGGSELLWHVQGCMAPKAGSLGSLMPHALGREEMMLL